MDLLARVGQNVRAARTAKGLTQEALAEAADVSQQYVSDLERGRCNATLTQLQKIADALGIQPGDLLKT
jgi:y4mF family transcriptional regulator